MRTKKSRNYEEENDKKREILIISQEAFVHDDPWLLFLLASSYVLHFYLFSSDCLLGTSGRRVTLEPELGVLRILRYREYAFSKGHGSASLRASHQT